MKLQDKIRAVEDEHAVEIVDRNQQLHTERRAQQAMLLLGGIRAVNRVQENLSSQVMEALITFQKEDMHTAFGYDQFADFLNDYEFSPMKKSEFYRRKELYEAEGGLLYDAFNSAKIPLSTRKLLASHNGSDIAIDGDELIVGSERIPIGNIGLVKEVVKSFADEIGSLLKEKTKTKSTIEDLETKITVGEAEFKELQRSLDAMKERHWYDRKASLAIQAMLDLWEATGQLGDEDKAAKSETTLGTLWPIYLKVRDSFGTKYVLEDNTYTRGDVHDLVAQVIGEDDDFGDEEEV